MKLLALVALLIISSCASGPTVSPQELAHTRSRALVHRSVEQSERASDGEDLWEVSARHNPARCECPDWEIRVRSQWERVWLEGDVDVPAEFETKVVRGRFSSRKRGPWRVLVIE